MTEKNEHRDIDVDVPAVAWTGRTDGAGREHLRWHQVVRPYESENSDHREGGVVFLGFSSDEGVERNKGRRGAAEGPAALRGALGGLALSDRDAGIRAWDAGTVAVTDERMEEGQARLGAAVSALLDAGHLPVVLGGGHEIAFGTYLGIAQSAVRQDKKLGVLNLDAHFDLRPDPVPSSGTPFRQMLEAEEAAETEMQYTVIGISQPSNTQVLFDTAQKYGVTYMLDEDCSAADREKVRAFVTDFLDEVDLVYLTIDLDGLPASTAPGVSAPAAYGVPLDIVQLVCDLVATSGKLAVCDVAELNPQYDVDSRTARTAARLVHRIATTSQNQENS
ncbi:formimidoylglutamase [Rothia uropygioeca]|uniref:formimidoylglutamase n=1 Tax=Kocuria sp. 257 TaxID=2021970 RepID=UPI0010119EF9|nr:formimidoylglutamase [Kocuria sp. 257]